MTAAIQTISLEGLTRADWLKLRRRGIGGSDVAAIIGISKWRTPLDIYNDKTEEGEPADGQEDDNPSMEWGRRLEPVIREKYADATGFRVSKPEAMFVNTDHPFMIADVDGICEDGRILECKTARSGKDWGEEGTGEIPQYYQTQVQHYMAVLGAPVCDVAVLIGGSDFRIYTVRRDQELIDLLIQDEEEFWEKHVVPGIPPAPMSISEMAATYPVSNGGEVEATSEIADALKEMVITERDISGKKAHLDELKAEVQGYMEESEKLLINGAPVATWKASKPRVTFDTKAFGKAEPDLYHQYLKEGAPTRRFMVRQAFADSIE